MASVKKPASGKKKAEVTRSSAAAKSTKAAKSTSVKKNPLAAQLEELVSDMDDEGLLFLIRQANTIIYNQRVDELNRQAGELQAERIKTSRKKNPVRKTGSQSQASQQVTVEKGAFGSSYIMGFPATRKTFGEHEMVALVKVSSSASGPTDAGERIYRWLKRNRDDVLLDAGISGPKSALLYELYRTLKATFQLREDS